MVTQVMCRGCEQVQEHTAPGTPCPHGCDQVLIEQNVNRRHFSDQNVGRLLGKKSHGSKYGLFDVLGKGSFGSVYRAYALNLDREVAIKAIRNERAQPDSVPRFHREAKVIAGLSSPFTVTLHDFHESSDGSLFMVMELVDGQTLEAVLDTDQRMGSPRTVRIALQILESLAEAHGQGVVHRDLKPGNIMLAKLAISETVKVLDFGMARFTERRSARDFQTMEPRILGTLTYMAPEQFLGTSEYRSDLYGLGGVLYRMLVGNRPFDCNGAGEWLQVHQSGQLPPPFPSQLGISLDLEHVVMTALAKSPGERYPDAFSMYRALHQAMESRHSTIEFSESMLEGDLTSSLLAERDTDAQAFSDIDEPTTPGLDDRPPSLNPQNPQRPAPGSAGAKRGDFDSGDLAQKERLASLSPHPPLWSTDDVPTEILSTPQPETFVLQQPGDRDEANPLAITETQRILPVISGAESSSDDSNATRSGPQPRSSHGSSPLHDSANGDLPVKGANLDQHSSSRSTRVLNDSQSRDPAIDSAVFPDKTPDPRARERVTSTPAGRPEAPLQQERMHSKEVPEPVAHQAGGSSPALSTGKPNRAPLRVKTWMALVILIGMTGLGALFGMWLAQTRFQGDQTQRERVVYIGQPGG